MIDIHSHIIFGVDDGAATIEESISMIEEEINMGVTDIICTPHYRLGMFEASVDKVKENFNTLVLEVKKRNFSVNLFLGREVHYFRNETSSLIKKENLFTINNKNYVLMEFSYTLDTDIDEIAYSMQCHDYKMIIAHVERYQYIDNINKIIEMKNSGCLIQVNASTICGVDGRKTRKEVLKYIKHDLVDFVASDIHFDRVNYLGKAYDIIKRKFGEKTAIKLFVTNQKVLL